jgi:hypothetical protein
MPDLGVAVIAAVISIAVVLRVHPAAVGGQLVASRSALPRPTADLPASWAEQVAAKVSPSVVMLQVSEGDRAELGSGIILTPDGLIMTNNHVVAGVGTAPHASARTVVTLNDGRDPDGFLVEHFSDGDMFDCTPEPGWAPFTASGLAQWDLRPPETSSVPIPDPCRRKRSRSSPRCATTTNSISTAFVAC